MVECSCNITYPIALTIVGTVWGFGFIIWCAREEIHIFRHKDKIKKKK